MDIQTRSSITALYDIIYFMNILITGANGMLAQAIKTKFSNPENTLSLTDSHDLDITNSELVAKTIAELKPDLIINCAAYTAVDKAEEQTGLAEKVNADGPKNLAIAARANDAILVHISTDYVFGGNKPITETYSEDDEKTPTSVYGKTKLAGELAIIENCDKYYIFRTAWLYGEGQNFVRTMRELAKTHDTVKVVSDQHGSPTYTEDLANIIYQTVENKLPYGTYHATNQGFTTWFEFTQKIYELTNTKCAVQPVTSEEYPTVAERPKNSQLSKNKLLQYGIIIPTWEDALERYLKKEQAND